MQGKVDAKNILRSDTLKDSCGLLPEPVGPELREQILDCTTNVPILWMRTASR